MYIRKLKVRNFKSFNDLDIELDNFSVLIGANASGKSNFVEIFKFIRDISNHGIQDALSMHGLGYLKNLNAQREPISVEFICKERGAWIVKKGDVTLGIKNKQYEYKFDVDLSLDDDNYFIERDLYFRTFEILLLEGQEGDREEAENFGEGRAILEQVDGKIKSETKFPDGVVEFLSERGLDPMGQQDIFIFHPREYGEDLSGYFNDLERGKLLLETPFVLSPFSRGSLDDIRIYDFDPKLPKAATKITGRSELEEDGSNLPLILKKTIDYPEDRKKFINLLKDLLPFIDEISLKHVLESSLTFEMKEIYHKQKLPALLLSDGTINLTSMVIALYFDNRPLVIFEEPGRNIHPSIISKMVNMMKEVSEDKQIIVTTHDPEFVKFSGLDNLLLISREEETGYSNISKPADRDDIRTFLENDIGLDDIFAKGLIG